VPHSETDLLQLLREVTGWIARQPRPSPFLNCGVDREKGVVVVGVRYRDQSFEERLRSEISDRIVFEQRKGEYRPL